MKLLVFALLLAVVSAEQASLQAFESQAPACLPQCSWNCDRPSCPAQCTPQCEKPQCELRCEKLPETACDIRCEKPKCEVRCSRSNCGAGGCPLCENVCLPAKCQTVCTPAPPKCKPTCSAPKCTWSCRKPATCPKPRCSLGCNGEAAQPTGCAGSAQCCPCNNVGSLSSAIEMASSSHREEHGHDVDPEMMPSFVELAHEERLLSQSSVQHHMQCCPCS